MNQEEKIKMINDIQNQMKNEISAVFHDYNCSFEYLHSNKNYHACSKLTADFANEIAHKSQKYLDFSIFFNNKCFFYDLEETLPEQDECYFFIHIPKCGGTSINSFLKNQKLNHLTFDGKSQHVIVKGNFINYSSFGYGVLPKKSINFEISNINKNKIKTFSTIRNPFSWLYSFYYHGEEKNINIKNGIDHHSIHLGVTWGICNVRSYFNSFKDFVMFFCKKIEPGDPFGSILQFRENPFYQIENSKLKIDAIIKIEQLEKGISEYFNLELSKVKTKLEKKNKNNHTDTDYIKAYDEEMIKAVKDRYGFLLEKYDYDIKGCTSNKCIFT